MSKVVNQYPFDALPKRTLIVAESGTVSEVRATLERLVEVAAKKRETFHTDAAGSPSESLCSESHLANILAVRDEIEARKLQAVKRK